MELARANGSAGKAERNSLFIAKKKYFLVCEAVFRER